MERVACRIGCANNCTGHHLLYLKDRCIAARQDIAADIIQTVQNLVAGKVLCDRLSITVRRDTVQRGAKQAGRRNRVRETVVLRVEVDQDLLARRKRVAICGAEFERVVEIVDAVIVTVDGVQNFLSSQRYCAVIGLENLDERLAGAVAGDPDRALKGLGQAALNKVVANRCEAERRGAGLEGCAVGSNCETARCRARHRAVSIPSHDDQVAAVQLGRDDRAGHFYIALVQNCRRVLGQTVDRAVSGIERTVSLAGLLVIALNRRPVRDDLCDICRQSGLAKEKSADRGRLTFYNCGA